MGTVFEDSHVPMTKWLQAFYLLCSSEKGISSHQLHRTLEVTLKTAWFMARRIRAAMRDGSLAPPGGFGHAVEADATFVGRKGKACRSGRAPATSTRCWPWSSAAARSAPSTWTA